ncbi:MAG: hypothetical protein Q8W51_09720 [Candidatus Palauibacterales bacterium]|nr:hypothetical protein [Candidatus Palauibacterales bacterium]MDP2530007.1 hypothetical protein [Candidatus Palauibacterales bacterium]MDP2585026.1 hypothetical protein [Candidatus Palauibacterales bacterium]
MLIDSHELMPRYDALLERAVELLETGAGRRLELKREFETFAQVADATGSRVGSFFASLALQAARQLGEP